MDCWWIFGIGRNFGIFFDGITDNVGKSAGVNVVHCDNIIEEILPASSLDTASTAQCVPTQPEGPLKDTS